MARKLTVGTLGTLMGLSASSLLLMKSRSETVWDSVTMPIIRQLDPEVAHRLSIRLASYGLVPSFPTQSEDQEVLVSRMRFIFDSNEYEYFFAALVSNK